jgi:hypothetical protein
MHARVFRLAQILALSLGYAPGTAQMPNSTAKAVLGRAYAINNAERRSRGKSRRGPRNPPPKMRSQAVKRGRGNAAGLITKQVTPLETCRVRGNRFARRALAKIERVG